MKRNRVYAHRTRKMREDFLAWLSRKNALQLQKAEIQYQPADRPSTRDLMARTSEPPASYPRADSEP